MPLYNYQTAKTVLTDKDKDRLLYLFLSTSSDGTVDWDKAAADFDCASVNSMKTMFYGTLKKIEKAGGKLGGGAASTASPATPASTTPKKARASKKRKASPVDENEDDEEATPATKKQSHKTEASGAVSKDVTKDTSGVKEETTSENEGETAA